MLKRRIYKELLEWKKTKTKECLLIKGARQVGKTYIVEYFGKTNYENFIEINFIFNPELISVFDGSLDVDTITASISAHIRNANFVPGNTLIFLDEIQKCPNARTALKSFALDNRYDVIASGSLLGLHYGQDPELKEEISSIPVGYEKQITMHSLDFEEFLWAIGVQESLIDNLHNYFNKCEKVPSEINNIFQDYLRQYIVVGGMPEVVSCFCITKNYGKVQEVQDKILASYIDDINRHTRGPEKIKVMNCYTSITKQLAKENKKFQFSTVEERSNARKYANSIEWLRDSGIVTQCYNLSTAQFPLNAYFISEYFKIYVNDIGMLIAMYGFELKKTILEKTLTGPVKGGIYENLVADMLIKKGIPLFYYKEGESNYEVEFIISKNSQIIPIEVKSKKGTTVSLDSFIKKFSTELAYKIIDGNIGLDGTKLTIPHYMTMFI